VRRTVESKVVLHRACAERDSLIEEEGYLKENITPDVPLSQGEAAPKPKNAMINIGQ